MCSGSSIRSSGAAVWAAFYKRVSEQQLDCCEVYRQALDVFDGLVGVRKSEEACGGVCRNDGVCVHVVEQGECAVLDRGASASLGFGSRGCECVTKMDFDGRNADGRLQSLQRVDTSCDGISDVRPSSSADVDLKRGCVGETVGECGLVGSQVSNGERDGADKGGFLQGSSSFGVIRGPNWVRNKKNRDDQKRRKLRRQQLGQDWRKGQNKSPVEVTHLKKGFFSDCAEDTQKQLKESRAKYLIAENERKAQEEVDKLAKLNSPEKTLFQAIKMIEVAEKQAKKANDSKIAGWAETVATSYAESIARSAPSSVPSFEAFSEKLAASSTSDLSLALEEKTKKNVELEQRIHELQDRMADVAVSQNSRIRQLCAKEVESEKKIELEKKKYDAVMKRVRELEEKECGSAHRLIPGTFRTRGVFEQFS